MKEWLVQLRRTNGLTQQQVAEKLNISQQYFSSIENGTRKENMDIDLATKIGGIFNLTVTEIIDLEMAKTTATTTDPPIAPAT
ncbi:MAG: helix-turn-helix transcriptional regulator [Eubacteriales bacterium]